MNGPHKSGRRELGRRKSDVRAGPAFALIAATLALADCSRAPLNGNGAAVDAAYGIPPSSVRPYLLRPDGLLINGLLPLQPGDTS
jgi:hypothetical protein